MRNVPAALLATMNSADATLADLVKITPTAGLNPLPTFGLSSIDADVSFDDGTGLLVYRSSPAADVSAFESSDQLEVGTADLRTLILLGQTTATEEQVLAGMLDYAEYVAYRVDWRNPTEAMILSAGTLGEVDVIDGAVIAVELRSKRQALLRPIVQAYSRTCRAVFGSVAGDPGVRYPCNFNANALWFSGTVASVSASEPDRTFTYTGTTLADGRLVPGKVEWLTGPNTGFTSEVEAHTGNTLSLAHVTPFNIAVGDTCRIREECGKRYVADCTNRFNNRHNFRGEPDLSGSDGSLAVSGFAAVPPTNPQPTPTPPAPGPSTPVVFTNLDGESSGGWANTLTSVGTVSTVANPALAHGGSGYVLWSGNTDVVAGNQQDFLYALPEFVPNLNDTITASFWVAIDVSAADVFSRVDPTIQFSVEAGGPPFAGPVAIGVLALGANVPYREITVTATVPPLANFAKVGLVISTTRGSADVRVDDVVISATTPV